MYCKCTVHVLYPNGDLKSRLRIDSRELPFKIFEPNGVWQYLRENHIIGDQNPVHVFNKRYYRY